MRNCILIYLLLAVTLVSCNSGKSNFSEHSSGLEYRFIETNTQGASPKSGDIVVLSLKYFTEDGRLIDESSSYRMQVANPGYKGDFHTALQMLQVGDSVCLKLDAANFYETTRKTDLPKELQQGDAVLIYLRLKNIIDAKSLETERRSMYHTDEQQELNLLSDYLKKANVTQEPDESGMYIIMKEEGTGEAPREGNKLFVQYTGTAIDGKVFDTSWDKPAPFSFTLGRGEVIRGWEEGFRKLKKGAKARFIIPSSLAYGKDGLGNVILPYSTLIFDVELIDIK